MNNTYDPEIMSRIPLIGDTTPFNIETYQEGLKRFISELDVATSQNL